MRLRVVGCGEAFDSGLGNNAFLLYGRGIPTVLFDCGYQVPERLWRDGLHRRIDAVYLTHTHADHAFGLVPLLTRYWEEHRSRPLVIIGRAGLDRFVEKLMDLGYPTMWPRLRFLAFQTLGPDTALSFGALTLRCAPSAHSVRNLSVRADGPGGKSVAVSGDGALTSATKSLYRGVDVLCHEVFALGKPVQGHTDLRTLERYARSAGIASIVVSHHARRLRSRLESAVGRLNTPGTRWLVARPGQSLVV